MTAARASRTLVVLFTLLVLLPTGMAGGYDAGTGGDAGNTRAGATAIAYGAYSGYVGSQYDADWYRAPAATEPSCVSGSIRALENPERVAFGLEHGANADLVSFSVATGATRAFGMAAASFDGAVLGVGALDDNSGVGVPSRPGAYEFALQRVGPSPRSAQDALTGADAGDSIATAATASGNCIQGHLDPLSKIGGDRVDTYRILTAPGDAITLSLGAVDGAPVRLTLLDAAGNAVTAPIGPNGTSSYTTSTGGAYYLSASSVSVANVEDIVYLIGTVVGPPGPPCRPNC